MKCIVVLLYLISLPCEFVNDNVSFMFIPNLNVLIVSLGIILKLNPSVSSSDTFAS